MSESRPDTAHHEVKKRRDAKLPGEKRRAHRGQRQRSGPPRAAALPSPAPVASLTEYVLSVVNAVLDRHERWIMQNTLRSGYARFALGTGRKFVVGEDFRHPEPIGRILPQLKIAPDECDWLFDSIRQRSQPKRSDATPKGTDVFERAEFQKRINEALSWYVSNVAFEPTIPEMRRQLGSRRKQVAIFFRSLRASEPVEYFLQQCYTGEVFARDELRPPDPTLIRLRDAYRERVGVEAITNTLKTVIQNIEAAEKLLAGTRPKIAHVRSFVVALAHAWKQVAGQWPKSGRDPYSGRQSGGFAYFVSDVAAALPEQYRIARLDSTIREVCKRSASPSPSC